MPEQYAVYAVDIRESAARLESLTKDKQVLKNQKRCTSCGAWIPNEDRFCGKCGAENEILVKAEAGSGEAEEKDAGEAGVRDGEQAESADPAGGEEKTEEKTE